MNSEAIQNSIRTILEAIGENPERDGLKDTPRRIADMYAEIFGGLTRNPTEHLTPIVSNEYNEIVLVRDITFHSFCEHHLLPFVGRAHIAYIPAGLLLQVSRIVQLVETLSLRPQVQERLTNQIADLLQENLEPKGLAVVIEASHTCMTVRGVKKPGTTVVTSAMYGSFQERGASREEVLTLLQGPSPQSNSL